MSLSEVLGWIDHRGGSAPFTWVIDPIDGTKGFLRRDQFAVAVGLLYEGEPVAGVLGCPHLPTDLEPRRRAACSSGAAGAWAPSASLWTAGSPSRLR